jgi:hypothetical protein
VPLDVLLLDRDEGSADVTWYRPNVRDFIEILGKALVAAVNGLRRGGASSARPKRSLTRK